MGLACGNKTVERKKQKGDLNKIPLRLRKGDNCSMMDHSWCTFLSFRLEPSTAHCSSPLEAPLEKQSWHTSPCAWAVSPLAPAFLAASLQWLLHYHGNYSKALNCHTLTGKLFAMWSPSVPTELSAVFLPLILSTTVLLMYDEGKAGVNCLLWAQTGSSLL